VLPLDPLRGLDYALSALFIVLALDAYLAQPDLRNPVLVLGCALAAMLVLPGQMLLVAYAAATLLLLLLGHGRGRRAARRGAVRSSGQAAGRA
jgi:branched chain amino acid efflux pump